MTFAHGAIAAYPVVGDPDKAVIRALLTQRFAYTLDVSENASDFIATDPVSGVVPLYLIQNSTMYAYDATDSTTAPSAVCLVTSDNKRYKTGTIEPPYSVLTRSTTAQPVSPADGARYLVPTAATGADWAGKDGKIAIYKGLGWHFAISPVGRALYVEDEDARYYRNASGIWTAGSGSVVLAAGAVKITNVFGANASYVVRVENQTTNAEPASPVTPTAYIIGPSPTGTHWAGNAGKLAICLSTGVWTIITPVDGDAVYDKELKNSYRYNSTSSAWELSAGAVVSVSPVVETFGTTNGTTQGGSGYYTYSATAPTKTQFFTIDDNGITWNARRAGVRLRIHYSAVYNQNASVTYGVLRDAETTALKWAYFPNMNTARQVMTLTITASDTSAHTYKMCCFISSGSNSAALSARLFQLEELAS